jgi:ribosomal-protein-alanine N-acetyltransferase
MLNINFTPFPNLETERLSLKQVTVDHADDIFELWSNTEVMKYIPRPLLQNKEEALGLIAMLNDEIENNIGINWGIRLKNDSKIIGFIGHYKIKPEHYRAEVGYMLLPEYNGKGIVSEALQRVVEYGFKEMQLHSLEAILDPENIGSEKVLLKNGFVKEAHLLESEYYEGKFLDKMIYSILNK